MVVQGSFIVSVDTVQKKVKFEPKWKDKNSVFWYWKSSVAPVSNCDVTKGFLICQQLVPHYNPVIDFEKAGDSELYRTRRLEQNLAVLIWSNPEKSNTLGSPVFTKSVISLDYGIPRSKHLFVVKDYAKDELYCINKKQTFEVLILNTDFKARIERRSESDFQYVDFNAYSLMLTPEYTAKLTRGEIKDPSTKLALLFLSIMVIAILLFAFTRNEAPLTKEDELERASKGIVSDDSYHSVDGIDFSEFTQEYYLDGKEYDTLEEIKIE